jgi:DUF177 domain-containing protein
MIFDTQEQKIYHARLMSARIVIDAHDFVRFTRSLHGKITLGKCARLKDYLADSQGRLEYKINGTLDNNDRPILQVIIKGEISLFCQRCLGKLAHTLNLKSTLCLAENEKELSYLDEGESVEGILATSDIDIIELIEDEIILSLPISPRHRENDCSAKELTNSYEVEKKHPFAVLLKLKKLH